MRKYILICCLLSVNFYLFAQNASLPSVGERTEIISPPPSAANASIEMDTLLQTNAVTYAQAARFVLEASDTVSILDPQEAFNYARERNWLPKNAQADAQARLDGISLLLMRSFDQKGGMFYSMARNARYAYREMLYKNIIQGRSDPAMKVTGERLLFITSRMLAQKEKQD